MNLGKRVMILGSSGSGKSTLAKRIGELSGLPVVHIDRFIWNPGWVATPDEEVRERIIKAADDPMWIIDGNNGKTRNYRLERADTVIFLDFNRYVCLYRVVKRLFENHGRTRYDLGEGCPDRLSFELLVFILKTYPRARGSIIEWLSRINSPKQVHHLKGNRAVKWFLTQVTQSYSQSIM